MQNKQNALKTRNRNKLHKLSLLLILTFIFISILGLIGCGNSNENVISSNNETIKKIQEKEEILEATINMEENENVGTQNKNIVVESKNSNVEKVNEETKEYENVTLAFVGDVYFSDDLYNNYVNHNNNVLGIMDETILNNFKDVDIMVANHEYATTNVSNDKKDTRQLYNFKSPTEREFLWNELGVDVVSLANNHVLDYGKEGFFDTLNTLEEININAIGAGENLDKAMESYITTINGKKIAILAACKFVVDGDWYATEDSLGVLTTYPSTRYFGLVKEEITRLKEEEKCDFVITYVHFGVERQNTPNEDQKTISYGYIDAGADMVIGSHAHTLQGVEFYNGKPIYYNLGNFLFGSYKVDTIVLNIEINEDNTCKTSIIPCIAKGYKVNVPRDENYQRILDYVESISINASIDENGNVRKKLNNN